MDLTRRAKFRPLVHSINDSAVFPQSSCPDDCPPLLCVQNSGQGKASD
jgi:hypothetical protein